MWFLKLIQEPWTYTTNKCIYEVSYGCWLVCCSWCRVPSRQRVKCVVKPLSLKFKLTRLNSVLPAKRTFIWTVNTNYPPCHNSLNVPNPCLNKTSKKWSRKHSPTPRIAILFVFPFPYLLLICKAAGSLCYPFLQGMLFSSHSHFGDGKLRITCSE